jgi:NTE family protein
MERVTPTEPPKSRLAEMLSSSTLFGELSPGDLATLASLAALRPVASGEVLVRQGTPADSLFFVMSGRFEVVIDGHKHRLTEVGPGDPVGEISFFTEGARTANVVAVRDSVVLALGRASFEAALARIPALQKRLMAALAHRLAETTARVTSGAWVAPARTIAVLQGGGTRAPPQFFDRLRSAFGRMGKCLFLAAGDIEARFPDRTPGDGAVAEWLNARENQFDLVVYLADDAPTEWTRTAIRQADQLLIVGRGEATPLNPVEQIAFASHPPARRRLILVHDRRRSFVAGTDRWLEAREVALHHHVALEDETDFRSLYRFLLSKAVGFVAGGGGGFGPAHVGIFKAFQERGVVFDMLGGTSVGAAMMGGFAILLSPEEVDAGTRDIFITSRAFERRTFPRYSFLDHKVFDEALRRQYHDASIEDAWRPYYAVATDVDRPGHGPHVIRRGPLWKAVRASASLPAILPPVLTNDGRLLVDGGVVDNVPVQTMRELKQGPNLVVKFIDAEHGDYKYRYESIPGRGALLRAMVTPFGMRKLPAAPGPLAVLRRCIGIHQNSALLPLGPQDLVLTPPAFEGSSLLDFRRHAEIFAAAYQWGRAQIEELERRGDVGLAAVMEAR